MRGGDTPALLRDLRIGAVVRDGQRVSYKILSKSPGAILVLKTERVSTKDDSVMPPVDSVTERVSRLHIAPTARLSDFEGWQGVCKGKGG